MVCVEGEGVDEANRGANDARMRYLDNKVMLGGAWLVETLDTIC